MGVVVVVAVVKLVAKLTRVMACLRWGISSLLDTNDARSVSLTSSKCLSVPFPRLVTCMKMLRICKCLLVKKKKVQSGQWVFSPDGCARAHAAQGGVILTRTGTG